MQLSPVVEAALDAIRPAADAKRIRLTATRETSISLLVAGDRDRLGQIIANLLTNAGKFTPPDGRVDVRVRRVGSHAEITVSDTGAGIAPEFLPQLFERFRQLQTNSNRNHGGLGLGLALVKYLTELHGGTVRVESAGVEQGTRFTVTLLLLDEQTALPREMERHDRLDSLRILLVEDHPDTREVLTLALQDRGADVTAVSSVADTLKAFDRLRPHVIVSDIGLQGDDGYELMRRIRVREATLGHPTPAVAVTALSSAGDRERAFEAGYQRHLTKPVDPAELARVIVQLVGRRSAG